jgi:hypothetical protein
VQNLHAFTLLCKPCTTEPAKYPSKQL